MISCQKRLVINKLVARNSRFARAEIVAPDKESSVMIPPALADRELPVSRIAKPGYLSREKWKRNSFNPIRRNVYVQCDVNAEV